MPKSKSHSGMSKRVRVTAGGKLMRQRAGRKAGATYASTPVRSTRQHRRRAGNVEVAKADRKLVKRLLGR